MHAEIKMSFVSLALRDAHNAFKADVYHSYTKISKSASLQSCREASLFDGHLEQIPEGWLHKANVALNNFMKAAPWHPLTLLDRAMGFDRRKFFETIKCQLQSGGAPHSQEDCSYRDRCVRKCMVIEANDKAWRKKSLGSRRSKCWKICSYLEHVKSLRGVCSTPNALASAKCNVVAKMKENMKHLCFKGQHTKSMLSDISNIAKKTDTVQQHPQQNRSSMLSEPPQQHRSNMQMEVENLLDSGNKPEGFSKKEDTGVFFLG